MPTELDSMNQLRVKAERRARELEQENRDLIERHAKLRKNLLDIQFSASGYCPACSGWNADPKDPKRGCTPGVHMKDCWLAAAIKED